jgi:hypothetical protein
MMDIFYFCLCVLAASMKLFCDLKRWQFGAVECVGVLNGKKFKKIWRQS